jgi:hypothetical protein
MHLICVWPLTVGVIATRPHYDSTSHRDRYPNQLLEKVRGVVVLRHRRHLATKSNQGVPSARNVSRQNPVVSKPSR